MRLVQVSSADVSLFHVAARELGDALQWWRIAELSFLTDPMLPPGVTSLLVPGPLPGQQSGLPAQ